MLKSSTKKRKEKWSDDKDMALSNIVLQFGSNDWTNVAMQFNLKFPEEHKTKKQCRARWKNISQANAKEPWSEKEEFFLLMAHNQYKNHWAKIAETLKGRNNGSTKNRFYSIFRRIKNKVLKRSYDYSSKFELLEILYIISVIEYYFDNPLDKNAPKRRRGIDYAYTLIYNLTPNMLQEYKAKILEKSKQEENMEDLFKELESSFKQPEPTVFIEKVNNQEKEPVVPMITNPIELPDNLLQNGKMLDYCDFLSPAKDNFSGVCSIFDFIECPQQPVFSPTCLSAGPAAAAAKARKAPCFKSPSYFNDFAGDFSNFTKDFLYPQNFRSYSPRNHIGKHSVLSSIPVKKANVFHELYRKHSECNPAKRVVLDDISHVNKQ